MEIRKNLKDLHEHCLVNSLIHQNHKIGDFRDSDDFETTKYHSSVTLLIIKDLIERYDWTREELLDYINSNLEGLKFFKAK